MSSSNPFRCVELSLPVIDSLDDGTQALLRALRFSSPPEHCVESSGQMDMAVMVYMVVMAMTPAELAACLSVAKVEGAQWRDIGERCNFFNLSRQHSVAMEATPPTLQDVPDLQDLADIDRAEYDL